MAQVVMDIAAKPEITPVVLRRDAKSYFQTRSYSPSRRRGIADFPGSISSDGTLNDAATKDSEIERAISVVPTAVESARIRPRSNIGNIEIKHEDTDSEFERKNVRNKVEEEGESTESEGWQFEGRQKVVRSLQFKESPKMKERTLSVQELVDGAENLLRQKKKNIESRDASGESTSDSDSCAVQTVQMRTPRPRVVRPVSLSCFPEGCLASGSRQWSASETSLNTTVKKRRLRPRRKFGSFRKGDGPTLSPAGGSDRPGKWPGDSPPALVKSESFSGMGRRERNTPSQSPVKCTAPPEDTVVCVSESSSSPSESTLLRGDESEEEPKEIANPPISFKLGPKVGAVSECATESEKMAGEEPSSLNTEDCWDDYQERYPSEQYSEDAEDCKHLLDFGEDYGQCLDSPMRGSRRRRLCLNRSTRPDSTESESELEEIRSLLDRSLSQYREVECLLATGVMSNYEELLEKCQDNISCLNVLISKKCVATKSKDKMKVVLEQWTGIQGRLEEKLQGPSGRVRQNLEQRMELLRSELCLLSADSDSERPHFENKEELDIKISRVKSDLNAIRDRKSQLLELNKAVHLFISVYTQYAPALKEEVVDLYKLWQATFDSVSGQLCELQRIKQGLQELEEQLTLLQSALRADKDTLRMIDSALQSEVSRTDYVDSARDLTKSHSEKDSKGKCGLVLEDTSLLLTEGSLSDSGISDSGSELELSEREKRLSSLKLLARQLEAILDPGSQALRGMALRIEEAEAELRGLQRTCRELITRSAANSDVVPMPRVTGKRRKSQVLIPTDPDEDPLGGSSWFWRVIRSALPFQLAIVALLCVACLLEPKCCDAINNLGLSHSSQFRFSGPPPV